VPEANKTQTCNMCNRALASSAHQLHSTSMTLDEMTKSSDTTPMSALRAGVAKTDELAPLIFAIADKLCSVTSTFYRKKTTFSSTVCTSAASGWLFLAK